MALQRKTTLVPRTVALCYVRQSLTRGEDDKASPDRQRANILEVCQKNGWTPEWFVDAEGHKSGREVANRPMWLLLEKRLRDPDVAALVANDLSRMHRRTWRIGELVDRVEKLGVRLVQAAPGREIDTSTTMGKMMLTVIAMQDEAYANDIAQRAKDSVQYRQKRGISIGMPPFGTKRGENGFLKPTHDGVWLLPNGEFAVGTAQVCPVRDAVWRGYYDATHRILSLYITGKYGMEKLSYAINEEGWAYRARTGEPRPFTGDDMRRIVAGWPAYGGVVRDRSAKDHPGYLIPADIDAFPFKEDRAVFDVSLLKRVALMQLERAIEPSDDKVKRGSYPYALSNITYCSHCEQRVRESGEEKLRTALSGRTEKDGTIRYKHRSGVKCGCTNRTVTATIIENDIGRILKLLSVSSEIMPHLLALAGQYSDTKQGDESAHEFEAQKKAALMKCQRKIRAVTEEYREGEIEREEYLERKAKIERDIVEWEQRTFQLDQVRFELTMCVEFIQNMRNLWDKGNPEQRKDFARTLFDHIVYDLDTQRIVSFELRPWAKTFLCLRAELYGEEASRRGENKTALDTHQGQRNDMPHTEFESVFCP
ncbi:MAG: recombinase family protein [Chloroflexi bacterium]|uniref:recombinase family protein n=1 Tax=Candidatus Flexifilum breve TaxID=3140694 RepID=UPI003134911D|nr:recombinase family protein [Chloroflexota bacterium]